MHPLFSVLVAAALLVLAAIGTYLFAATRPRIPAMPTVSIPSHAGQRVLTAMEQRVRGVVLSSEELRIVEKLDAVHAAETDVIQGTSSGLRAMVQDAASALSPLAKADRNRFLLVGDFLAHRFHTALMQKLEDTGRDPRETARIDMQLALFGGRFYWRAKERGLIAADGRLTVPEALLPLLFRYRWRLLGEMDDALGFDDTEKRLLYDFEVRFLEAREMQRRLRAVRALAALDPEYDAAVAEALVRHQGGDTKGALKRLREAEAEASDVRLSAFIKALE